MRFQFPALLAIGSASLSFANPQLEELSSRDSECSAEPISSRPNISVFPKAPANLPAPSPARNRTCNVESHGDSSMDDSEYVFSALQSCNDGGHVVFKKGINYTIGTALDLTFLNHIDIEVQSQIQFTNNTDYWQANSFRFVFQNVTSFFKLGGNDVNIYGGGLFDGNGQVWYDLYAKDIYTLRPVLFGLDGLHDSTISNLFLRYSPQYYFFIANSTGVVIDNIDIAGKSTSEHEAKNTDGYDTYRSSGIVIQNSRVINGDVFRADCVSFKPNSTDIIVQNMYCVGSHGMSCGSLGQYKGAFDIVEDIYVYNVSMYNASNAARIKVWPNVASAQSGDLQGGGGDGRVRNLTFDTMIMGEVDYAIQVNQCYGQKNLTLCLEFPSPLTIKDIVFKNFQGTTSKKYQPEIAAVACSSKEACANISATSINVKSPNGTRDAYCLNVNETSLDLGCGGPWKGFN
ncbi:hypothetical protein HYFRA_00012207 [Hymenoscyphus fraxineus]|uniref:galacturonan 1,4-alpha-galacturonidase n=1 Tax=Hymenoscyphus fraxineus TaxID=746836 RepID=A0A9N9PVG1_9HELO|nr:hypothetical protein HYFRA_00012207 [Hymenoscyphus fraxineus]